MITWSENYLMGIEKFDEEHQQTFKLAKQVIERMLQHDEDERQRFFVIREMLTYINNYFAEHVREEEAYMREIGYEGYALHKMLHDDFLKQEVAKYEKIIQSGVCDKEEVWDFIGSGIGWLLEHIASADLAIVGKGLLAQTKPAAVNAEELEREVNQLLTATMNMEMDAKIISTNYAGEYVGKMVHWKTIYRTRGGDLTVISGIEQKFVMDVARQLFGEDAQAELGLIRSTVRMFDRNFWATLARRFVWEDFRMDIKQDDFIEEEKLAEELRLLQPTASILFTSNRGRFFTATDSPFPMI